MMTSSHASRSQRRRWSTTRPRARVTLRIKAFTTTTTMCRRVRWQRWSCLLAMIAADRWTTNRTDVIWRIWPTNRKTWGRQAWLNDLLTCCKNIINSKKWSESLKQPSSKNLNNNYYKKPSTSHEFIFNQKKLSFAIYNNLHNNCTSTSIHSEYSIVMFNIPLHTF